MKDPPTYRGPASTKNADKKKRRRIFPWGLAPLILVIALSLMAWSAHSSTMRAASDDFLLAMARKSKRDSSISFDISGKNDISGGKKLVNGMISPRRPAKAVPTDDTARGATSQQRSVVPEIVHHLQVSNSTARPETIPRRLVFTYKWNLFEKPEPQHLVQNVLHTIRAYRTYWLSHDDDDDDGHVNNKMEVIMMDDKDCLVHVRVAAPGLVHYYQQERFGPYKSDICRVAFLYRFGGYYFDVDMQVIKPYVIMHSSNVTFSTAHEAGNHLLFQSFLASTPGHPVLRESLRQMQQWYNLKPWERGQMCGPNAWMGPCTMKHAYTNVVGRNDNHKTRDPMVASSNTYLLQELNLMERQNGMNYPNVTRRKGTGCCCNYIVVDPRTTEAFFYSRMVGAGAHCNF